MKMIVVRMIQMIWRRYKLKIIFGLALCLLILALHGIRQLVTWHLPYMFQYEIQVTLEDGRTVEWECLEKKYGIQEERDNDIIKINKMRKLRSTELRVPNTVHFIFFGQNRTFSFLNYLSVLSAYKVQNPDVIMVHCDYLPTGKWWKQCIEDVPTLTIMRRSRPVEVGGSSVNLVYHASDIARLQILLQYGGIYLDYDVILIQPLDNLRHYPCAIGKEKVPKYITGVIVAERNALFIKIWYAAYRRYFNDLLWDYNSGWVPYQLHKKHPRLIHVEDWRLTTPDWTERYRLFEDDINWRDLYTLHMMFHQGDQFICTPERLLSQAGIAGAVLRNIYYGRPDMPAHIMSQNHSCLQ